MQEMPALFAGKMKAEQALQGVKVIEYGNLINAPYCAKLLADLGADVIKVEPIGGDIARRRGPFLDDVPGLERSGLFLYLNTNKLGITLNINKSTGKEILKNLVKDADVFIEDTSPGTMGTLGLGYEMLKQNNPRLVMTSITPFGQTGPYHKYKSSDLIAWHMGGPGYTTPRHSASVEQEPLRVTHMASFITANTAAVAIMSALHVQRHKGIGQHVDVSQQEAVLLAYGLYGLYWPYEHRSDSRATKFAVAPICFLKCKDGWIFLNAIEPHHWQRLVEAMGNPEWANEELFKDAYARAEHWDSLEPLMAEWAKQCTMAEAFEAAREKKIPMVGVNTVKEIMESPQLEDRKFLVNLKHPVTGELTYPGAPYQLSETPWELRRPAPMLGQHNEEIYCKRLGYTKTEMVKLYESGII